MIHFEHVSKRYSRQPRTGNSLRTALAFRRPQEKENFTALSDINFTIRAGEAVGVMGRNGAGKSTLLKLLTRVVRPSSGRIYVNGRMSSLLEVGAGFHHDLSGHENIFLAGTILGMSRKAIKQHYDEIVAFAEVAGVLDQPVRTYSSGMFLRLAFSVGIHLQSDILVIDEALAVGDYQFQQRCYTRIKQFHQAGGTLVLVSHDETQLSSVCQRGLVIEQGRLTFDGDLSSALNCYLS